MLTGVSGRRAGWALVLAVACAVLFTLYLSESRTSAANSDGAANVLQGLAMDHGNLLLRGWWTSDVSFYSTELPEYALVTAVRGVSSDVVHLCGALTYTLTVALAALLARGRASGRAHDLASGWYRAGIAVGIAVGILLTPTLDGGTQVFLENPDHAGTAVPVLLLLLLLDRVRAVRWPAAAAVCALLAVTQLGDQLSLVAATVPLAGACAVGLLTAAVRRRPRAAFRPDGLLLAAAVSSAGLAWLAGVVIRSLGGFHTRHFPDALLVPLGQVPADARGLWQAIVLLFGANSPGVPLRPIAIAVHGRFVLMADLHVIGLVLALAGFAAGIAVVASGRADRVSAVLVAAIALTLAAGVFSPVLHSLASAHEVAIVVPLAAALAGRTLPPLARRVSSSGVLPRALSRVLSGGAASGAEVRGWPARLAAVSLAGWLAAGAVQLCWVASWSPRAPAMQAVADWLVTHHEREGLAGYWQADITTVTSGGRVLVAPVTGPGTTTDRWESSAGWYRPGTERATFVIAVPAPLALGGALSPATVRAQFGPPAAQYRVGADIIMTYRYNLLNRLSHRAFPGQS